MIIHFTASSHDMSASIQRHRRIVSIIRDTGHLLARDWIEVTYAEQRDNTLQHDKVDWHNVYEENINAVSSADLLIADCTGNSFGVGYLVATAIQQKKPVLLLVPENGDEGMILKGLYGELVEKSVYTQDSLNGIVTGFIERNTLNHKDLRFNFFLDQKLYNYLNWSSLKSGKTKAEIVRDLIEKDRQGQ